MNESDQTIVRYVLESPQSNSPEPSAFLLGYDSHGGFLLRSSATDTLAFTAAVDFLYRDMPWQPGYQHWPCEASFYKMLRELPYLRIMNARDKYYFVPTESDPAFNSSDRDVFPQKLALHRPVGVSLKITDDLRRWAEVGRVHEVLLRLRITGHVETDRIEFRLNSTVLPRCYIGKSNQL